VTSSLLSEISQPSPLFPPPLYQAPLGDGSSVPRDRSRLCVFLQLPFFFVSVFQQVGSEAILFEKRAFFLQKKFLLFFPHRLHPFFYGAEPLASSS